MDFRSLVERLQEMFPDQYKSDVEKFISSKNPKTTSDVEYWLQQYTYSGKNWPNV